MFIEYSVCHGRCYAPKWLCMQAGHSTASRAVVKGRYIIQYTIQSQAACVQLGMLLASHLPRQRVVRRRQTVSTKLPCLQVNQPFADILHVIHHCHSSKWRLCRKRSQQASTNRYDLPNAPLVMQLHRPVCVTLPKPMTENVHVAFPPLPMEHGQHEIVVALRLKLPMLSP